MWNKKKVLLLQLCFKEKEDWQSDRMRWTRNPVYPFPGIGGLNPSSSAEGASLSAKLKGNRKNGFLLFVLKIMQLQFLRFLAFRKCSATKVGGTRLQPDHHLHDESSLVI